MGRSVWEVCELDATDIQTSSLAHYGIVAGIYDELGIGDLIDSKIPKMNAHKVSHGTMVKSFIINGLGFVCRRLYLFPEFFENLPTERLFGPGILPEYLNQYSAGETLDQISEYGPTKLYTEVILEIFKKELMENQYVHVDTTNFSVHGDYEGYDGSDAFEITFGHPKDGRWDLKRFVLSLATNQNGIPIYTEILSGNAPDKETIIQSIESINKYLEYVSQENLYYVADSSFYSEDNIKAMGVNYWMSRVPATLNSSKDLLYVDATLTPSEMDKRYSFYETYVTYGGIEQKWVLIRSEHMLARQEKSFQKRLIREEERARKELRKLQSNYYFCEDDARKALQEWIESEPFFEFEEMSIKTKIRRKDGKRGRPGKNTEMETTYRIRAKLVFSDKHIEYEKQKLGRFILATNDLNMKPDDLLKAYKNQSKVERGFRFLKDKSFRVAEVYLKKKERIEALMVVMVIALMIYNYAEQKLRQNLEKSDKTVPDQKRRPTKRPTMKWCFFLFTGVTEVFAKIGTEKIAQIANMTDVLWDILELLGEECKKYYV